MLARLSISNYALIENLDLQPGEGLSIITGETGAGKSVMMGALSLLKGERADTKVIADKSKKSVVEGIFTAVDPHILEKVKEFDPEFTGDELIMRREILPSGRTRAFINDTPATLSQLADISRGLLDIHSQNSNSLLSEEKMQLRLLDSVAGVESLLSEYENEFRRYVSLRQKIKALKEEAARNNEQAEIIRFRLAHLDKLRPKEGELKKIELRYETLSNSEEIRERLTMARNLLSREDSGALDGIESAASMVSDLDFTLLGEESDVAERLRQCAIEIKDIAETLDSVLGDIEYDPAVIAALSGRMQAYYTAFKTFNVSTDKDLQDLHEDMRRRYDTIENGGEDSEALEREAREVALGLKDMAARLSRFRSDAAEKLKREIEDEARKLGLENLRFEIEVSPAKLTRTGGDKISFKAAFNLNQTPVAVGEMASGGEMARLMLAVKNVTSRCLLLPTVVFDEIDTGVSGYIADRMGEMMTDMSRRMQIITITHLPQVAAKGARHFRVYKEDRRDKTVSDIKLLSREERVEEIARMLSGETIGDAALGNARSLLGINN